MQLVINDFAPIELVNALLATWTPAESGFWHVYNNGKRATKDPSRIPAAGRLLLNRMAGIPIQKWTNIPGIFPDLEYCHGAGMHEIPAGGDLGLHLDTERHPSLPWRREASAVLYLEDCDGGTLDFCQEDGTLIQSIEAKQNRLAVFTTPGCWHRVSKCNSVRRSLCLFFWSVGDGGQATTATFR